MIGLVGGVTKENKKRECEILPSKREMKKYRKYVENQAFLFNINLTRLMYQELLFERRARNKALRMAKKRDVGDYIK